MEGGSALGVLDAGEAVKTVAGSELVLGIALETAVMVWPGGADVVAAGATVAGSGFVE